MPLIVPVLDDRSYAQLYTGLRNRIPVYNPEWTDYNDSDPAITLLQLFAYLGEGLQFRFNQIPEATQLAFLRLLDLPLEPARPATALLRCSCKDSENKGVQIYAGDEVKAGKTVFTIDGDAEVWPLDCVAAARQKDVMPDQTTEPELHAEVQGTIDAVTALNPGLAAIVPYRTVLLESDGTSPPLSFADAVDGCVWIAVLKTPGLKLDLAPGFKPTINIGFSPSSRTPTLDQVEKCPGAGVRTGPPLEWQVSLQALDSEGSPQYRSVRVFDATAGFTQEGVARLVLPDDYEGLGVPSPEDNTGIAGTGAFPPVLDGEHADKAWFWIRVWRRDNIPIGEVRLICVNALTCVQAVIAQPEILGSGSGQPNQVFELANRPVLVDPKNPVKLQVQEADVWTEWVQRDDLDASGPGDRHFVVDAEAGTVRFGERFPYIGERVRAESYRYGGGSAGNVPAKSIQKVGDLRSDVKPAGKIVRLLAGNVDIGNPFAAEGGDDNESLEHALQRIPGDVRRRTRAVTRDDFSELAMMTPGVKLGRAECLPLFHAPDQVSPRAGVVSVVVWPARDPVHPNAPLPDAYELKRVCEWLDTKRLVTTELYVIPPSYRRIAISLAVKVKDGFGLDAVRDWVDLMLRQYLAPLPPYGPDAGGWPLGRRVFDRELEGVVMQVDGVEYVDTLRLAVAADNNTWSEIPSVELRQWEVPEVAAITVVDDATDPPPPGAGVTPPVSNTPVPIPVLRDEC